jgi:UDP-N-acetyl-D-glucosamine/UDP-N-acetyl-D-galactosamine dehydrogenase
MTIICDVKLNRKISVIGLGYVGLPVAVAFGRQSAVIGFDTSQSRIAELIKGCDSTKEVKQKELRIANIFYTTDPEHLRKADFHIVAVPTPINEAKQPDLTPLLHATESVGRILKRGDIVVYESTVYPGCTEEECVPILERISGLKFNVDFGVGYSPERINPGDKKHTFAQIKKVVSGSNPEASLIIADVYASVVTAGIYIASSLKVAEAAKVIENAQRDLNIAFVNELALIFNHLGIDTHEVLEAAGTKWNFLPFRPGLVGGHCIGVDPYYLTHRAERAGYHPQMILAGRHINDSMGSFVAQQTVQTLASAGIGAVGAKVTVLGLTFKEDCPDLRNSRVGDILTELSSYGCKIQVHDPFCSKEEALEIYGFSLCDDKNLKPAHAVVLAVAHQPYRKWLPEHWISLLVPGGVVIDVNNITPANKLQSAGHLVWKL